MGRKQSGTMRALADQRMEAPVDHPIGRGIIAAGLAILKNTQELVALDFGHPPRRQRCKRRLDLAHSFEQVFQITGLQTAHEESPARSAFGQIGLLEPVQRFANRRAGDFEPLANAISAKGSPGANSPEAIPLTSLL